MFLRSKSQKSGKSSATSRSRDDTKRLYKKLSQMGGIAASIMSVKRDYTSLQGLASDASSINMKDLVDSASISPIKSREEIEEE